MTVELHVVFGAGQVGYRLAERLLAMGKRVRVAKRSASQVPEGADLVLGDATDPIFCADAARGASVAYHCMNPGYDTRVWSETIPRYMNNLIAACARTSARLVVLDNVYMLGRPGGHPLNEDTPMNPSSRKGEVRARAAERLFEAHKQGDVVATSGRASDYYGPGGTQTATGDFFWPRVLAGRTAYLPLGLDAVHTYHYIPDVATGLAMLGCADADAYGRPWMLPCAPAGSLRELIVRLAKKLDREIRVREVPQWVVKTAAVFVPLFHELAEMRYQWEEPFIVDDRRFRERFRVAPTNIDQAAADTVTWALQHYRYRASA